MRQRHYRARGGAALICALILTSLMLALFVAPAAADREMSWVLDRDGDPLAAPVAYVFDYEIDGLYKGSGTFKSPADLFMDHEGYLWISDTGNNRIIKFTQDGRFVSSYGPEEGPGALNAPEGVFITRTGEMWVADRGNSRVVVYGPDGSFIRDYPKPSSKLLAADQVYQPSKVVVDRRGSVYVLNAGGDYRGIFLLDAQGVFRGFFAANRLPFNILRLIVQAVTTAAQKRQISKILPTHHANMYLDDRGFIWAVAPLAKDEQIKKLSAVGTNVYRRDFAFGDAKGIGLGFRRATAGSALVASQFIDVAASNRGIVSALDFNSGRIYQYDQLGNLLAVFGGRGAQRGRFDLPTSLVGTEDGSIFVLDANRNNIQRYRPTGYTQLLHEASALFYDGYYPESADVWREVLRRNSNFEFGHVGVAKAYFKQGDYLDAMQEYAVARDTQGYSLAFGEYRHDFMRANFGWVMPLFIMAIWLGITLITRAVKRIMALNLEVEEEYS